MELFSGWAFKNKNYVQWIRTVSLKQNYRIPQNKISTFPDFPRTMGFDGLGPWFCFSRWCCLHVEFYGLNGIFIMESVVIRSGAHYSEYWPNKQNALYWQWLVRPLVQGLLQTRFSHCSTSFGQSSLLHERLSVPHFLVRKWRHTLIPMARTRPLPKFETDFKQASFVYCGAPKKWPVTAS